MGPNCSSLAEPLLIHDFFVEADDLSFSVSAATRQKIVEHHMLSCNLSRTDRGLQYQADSRVFPVGARRSCVLPAYPYLAANPGGPLVFERHYTAFQASIAIDGLLRTDLAAFYAALFELRDITYGGRAIA